MEDIETLERIAYAMEAAYKREDDLLNATHSVAEQFPDFDTSTGILRSMWLAIDAYVDLNT